MSALAGYLLLVAIVVLLIYGVHKLLTQGEDKAVIEQRRLARNAANLLFYVDGIEAVHVCDQKKVSVIVSNQVDPDRDADIAEILDVMGIPFSLVQARRASELPPGVTVPV